MKTKSIKKKKETYWQISISSIVSESLIKKSPIYKKYKSQFDWSKDKLIIKTHDGDYTYTKII